MALPLAYLLTWACYGQRLHGDKRGSVDRFHNMRGTPVLAPDQARESRARRRMKGKPVLLTRQMRTLVESAIAGLCKERRWLLITQSARSTHCHAVLNYRGTASPERALAQVKARATSDLRSAGLAGPSADVWAEHGSTRWINFAEGLAGAIAYVNDWQDGPNKKKLEEHRRKIEKHMEELRAWLRAQCLPENGRTVVPGESEEDRKRRVYAAKKTPLRTRNEDLAQ